MQNQNDITPSNLSDPESAAASAAAGKAAQNDFVRKIVDKIKNSENILIALAKDPSVDEIAAAIGLTLYLGGMQKHATAIYSGRTPDELSFLQPGETFEKNTDSLQDFIISLNKDKADHLRYKLEGDFVKVFITPYKTKLTEEDLNFSYGDYNVDFVIAINVPAAGKLDEALREHGRIMHDASVVNITTDGGGRFGEIEWSNPAASSVCEMVTELVFALKGDDEAPLEQDIATALLTGIVAATDRFSNNRTHSDTLSLASKLMSMGADQQLISANVRGNEVVHNDELGHGPMAGTRKDKTNLTIDHEDEMPSMNPYANMTPEELERARAEDAATGSVNVSVVPGGAGSSVAGAGNGSDSSVAGSGVGVVGGDVPDGNAAAGTTNGVVTGVTGEGASGASAAGAVTNLAAQVAPAQSAVPEESMTSISATNNVAPEDVTVQPVIPGGVARMVDSDAAVSVDGADGVRPVLMGEAPLEPTTRQFGNAIQPPVPQEKEEKNYAEMMAAALAEPSGGVADANAPVEAAGSGIAPAGAANVGASDVAPRRGNGVPVSNGVPVPNPVVESRQGKTAAVEPGNSSASVPVMEPVANPNAEAVLPPPPAPSVGAEMMPPVLPPVR